MKQSEIIADLESRVEHYITLASDFKSQSSSKLTWKPTEDNWNVLECLEHLSLYGDFYLPEFERVILKARKEEADKEFKPGWFGGYSAKSMLPKEGGVVKNQMNTFKHKNPVLLKLPEAPIERFIKQQTQLLRLLDQAKSVNLNGNRTRTTLPGIRFKLGDTLRFVVFHQERHLQQASKALASASE